MILQVLVQVLGTGILGLTEGRKESIWKGSSVSERIVLDARKESIGNDRRPQHTVSGVDPGTVRPILWATGTATRAGGSC